MRSLSPRLRAVGAIGVCLVVGVVAALAVDPRLDRSWLLRGVTLLLACACALVFAADNKRRIRLIVAVAGTAMFGIVFPSTMTAWSEPPEIEFALQVADEAHAIMTRKAQSGITIEDVQAAAQNLGGAVGSPPTQASPEPRGVTEYPLIIRRDPAKGRPWACLTIVAGYEAKVRAC